MLFSVFFPVAAEKTSDNYCLRISNSEEEKDCCDILGVRLICFCVINSKKKPRELQILILFYQQFGNTTLETNAASQNDKEIGSCAKMYLKMVDSAEGYGSGFGAQLSFRSVSRGEDCKLMRAKWFMQILCCRQKLPNICHG